MKLRKCAMIILGGVLGMALTGCGKEIPVNPEAEVISTDTQEVNSEELEPEKVESEELQPEEGASLLFWTSLEEYGAEIAKAFEEKYNIPVTVEKLGMGEIEKMSLTGPSGTAADVFMSSHDQFIKGIEAGLFMEFDDQIADRVKERVSQTGIQTVTQGDKLYGVPVSIETSCLFYNKDLVETPETTLEEIIEKSKSYNDVANNEYYFLHSMADVYKAFPMLSAYGYRPFGPNGTDNENPGFDTPEYKQGLECINSFREIMPISAADLRNAEFLRSLFVEGKVAYEITGPWDITQFKESGINLGVTTLPTYNGKQLTPFAGVKNAHVSAWTKYPIAAQLFAEFLVSDEGASILYEKADQITTLKDISNVRGLNEDECVKPFVEQFENSIPMPTVKNIGAFWTSTENAVIAMYDGQLTPEEAQQNTIDAWNTTLATENELE